MTHRQHLRHRRQAGLALLALCLLPAGCDTRRNILDDQGVWVRVEADWRQARILPNGASIYVFNQETGARTQLLTNEMRDSVTRDSLKLHAGNYSLLAFNETERSHDYLSFRGTHQYHTAEAYANPLELAGSRYAGRAAVQSAAAHTTVAASDVLAAAHIDHFEIGYDVIRNQAHPLLRLTPQRLNTGVNVIIHVQNMHSLHTGQQQAGALNNLAAGVFLAAGSPNASPVTHWFALTPVAFDPDTKTGTLRAAFATFGALNTGQNTLALYFMLRDDLEYTLERDVTAQMHRAETMPERTLTVEIGLGIPGDPIIELPDIAGDGMFEVDIDSWDDNTNIDIPI